MVSVKAPAVSTPRVVGAPSSEPGSVFERKGSWGGTRRTSHIEDFRLMTHTLISTRNMYPCIMYITKEICFQNNKPQNYPRGVKCLPSHKRTQPKETSSVLAKLMFRKFNGLESRLTEGINNHKY